MTTKKIDKLINDKVNEAMNKYELQKASVGSPIPLTEWIRLALLQFYIKGRDTK